MNFDPEQTRAIQLARTSKVLVITGGPGTGKTTVLSRIIQETPSHKTIALASPTGKAAKRLAESTKMPAMTIHRLLAYHPFHGFLRNEDDPIGADLIVIDEMSMVDVQLMFHLMKAVHPDSRLILVGDVDQLPSVGPGRVFGDIIASGMVPTVRLLTIHRQAAKSLIKKNAHKINNGEALTFDQGQGDLRDMWLIPEGDPQRISDKIMASIKRCLQLGYKFDDIQVLTPMKRGIIGTHELNERIGGAFNANGRKIKGSYFKSGDRVIQVRNNYDLEIFNGDIGRVYGAGSDGSLLVDFDTLSGGTTTVEISPDCQKDLIKAYALTVHKSQGSEYPVVIMPIHKTHYIMLKRNLLYTGVTRAKKMMVLIGDPKAVGIAIRNVDERVRYSRLAKLMK